MLTRGRHYLQIALNYSLGAARNIIAGLPADDRIILEAGTPLLKRYGAQAISRIKSQFGGYVVADYKTMDRGETEVELAASAGADAITVLGSAPKETIDHLMLVCQKRGIDPIIDMMNVKQPIKVLRLLKKPPPIVMLHRGVDEEKYGSVRFPIHLINSIKGSYDVKIAVGGGDNLREIQSAVFNGADIVMVWKDFFASTENTAEIAKKFLEVIK